MSENQYHYKICHNNTFIIECDENKHLWRIIFVWVEGAWKNIPSRWVNEKDNEIYRTGDYITIDIEQYMADNFERFV